MADILLAPSRWVLVLSSSDPAVQDFSRYDGYLNELGVLYLSDNESRKADVTLELRPPKQDVGGQSEFEARPEFGDWFSQGDFSHGAGQRYYHHIAGRDSEKYLRSRGFDISEPGVLRHLNSAANALVTGATDNILAVEEFNDLPFVTLGNFVYRGDAAWPGAWTQEDPRVAEGATAALDLATNGAVLYAALGANGVHQRTTAGTWSHIRPDGATDLSGVGDVTKVRWLKDRLMIVGDNGRGIYEIVADSTPTVIETLPTGWSLVDIFEAGKFIFACTVNPTAGVSRVHAYGLNSGGTAIEKKTSTPMPKGTLAYCGIEASGRIFIGGGRQNSAGGVNAAFYEAVANETGELQFALIAAEEDLDTDDLSVRSIVLGADCVKFGWGVGNLNPRGRFVGLGYYNLARNAFAFHLDAGSAADHRIHDLTVFRGRTLFSVANIGLFYEKLGVPITTATLETSVADWNNASLKTWDLFEITHHPLPINTSILVQYTKKDPDEADWQLVMTSSNEGAIGLQSRLEDVISRTLTLKLTSTATVAAGPEFQVFSVRSTPTPDNTEWRLVRTVRVLDRDRKDSRAEIVNQDPRTVRAQIEDLARTYITLFEPGKTWIAFVEGIAKIEPASAQVSETAGTSEHEAYYFELRMVGRRAA